MKPHGLDLILKEEILENGKVVNSFESTNSFEAWIGITNTKNKKYVELPMRSFVTHFLDRIKAMFDGSDGTVAKYLGASAASGGSTAKHYGLMIGQGETTPELSDSSLESQASHASLAYGVTTFQNPAVDVAVPPIVLKSEVRRLFSNNKSTTFYISEVGLFGKAKNAASIAASNVGNHMLSRDLIYDSETNDPIQFIADSDIRFDFKFKITHPSDGSGGLMLNFMKLIHNTMFKGGINNTPKIISVGGTQPTYKNASTSASAVSVAPFYVKGTAAQIYYGIVVGIESLINPEGPAAYLTGDETTIDFMVDEFTCSANTISSVSSGNRVSSFTISRTFTNAATSSKTLRRVGIAARGNSTNGTTYHADQFLIAVNTPTDGSVTIQPSQVYRVTYTFKIQV